MVLLDPLPICRSILILSVVAPIIEGEKFFYLIGVVTGKDLASISRISRSEKRRTESEKEGLAKTRAPSTQAAFANTAKAGNNGHPHDGNII